MNKLLLLTFFCALTILSFAQQNFSIIYNFYHILLFLEKSKIHLYLEFIVS